MNIPFRRAVVLLLVLWTLLFFLGQLFHSPPLPDRIEPIVVTVDTNINTNTNTKTKRTVEVRDPFPKELSVVLLNWNRTHCVKTIVQQAQVYHDFITEVVIGNNNPDITLKASDFESPLIPVRVVNFPQNRYFYARYELCLSSKGLYCYMQDDDWDNRYLRSLYANFLRSPHLLHTDTNSFVHFLSWSWTFFDPDINLHSGFSWLGTGAISSKQNVERFIYEQADLIERGDLYLADMYFSTWFNQVPYQLENELFELDVTQTGFSNQAGGILRNKLHITKGIQILHKHLSAKSLFPQDELYPKVEHRYIKAPCFADDCLFMTSVHSFPNPRTIKYDAYMDLEYVEGIHKKATPYVDFTDKPYHYAVDDSMETAWVSPPKIPEGAFFGLDLLSSVATRAVYVKVRHSFQLELKIQISDDGLHWSDGPCQWDKQGKIVEQYHYYRYKVTSRCECTFRFIRFSSADKPRDESFHVFDISVKDRSNLWGQDGSELLTDCSNSPLIATQAPDKIKLDTTLTVPMREIGNGDIPVTLILLNWKRIHNFPSIFKHLRKYPFINEYIIWNNNNAKTVDMSMLFPNGTEAPSGVSVRIINSPQNLHDYGKYLSCSLARNEYCYFQDDDWQNIYLRSQYTSFLRFPHLFHSMTIPIIFLEHRRWNIYDASVGLHAGFSWLGVGSFTSKQRVQNFLHQCSLFNLNQAELLQADLFFSYLNNDYPVEMSTRASQLDQSGAWSASVDQWGIVYSRLLLAAKLVHENLQSNISHIPRTNPTPAYEDRDVRAPCVFDNCLFLTNDYPFPYPNQVVFDPKRTIKEQEALYNSRNWPSNWHWVHNSYERAVDDDIFTNWGSYHVARKGDYFGLDLLTYKNHTKITIVLDHDIDNYHLRISSDGNSWETVTYLISKSWTVGGPLKSYTVSVPMIPFRLFNFALKDGELLQNNQVMSVYEISEGDSPRYYTFSTNKVLNPSFEDGNNNWKFEFPSQAEFDRMQLELGHESYTGLRSLVFQSQVVESTFSATQDVILNQLFPKNVSISVVSKSTDAVNGEWPGAGYAVLVHLNLNSGKTEWSANRHVFNPGTHGWQPKVFSINPKEALRSVSVELLFSKHTGTVYFDEVSVQEIL